MEELLALARDPQAWAALATLVVMEVVLGIDNLIFISILTNKLPEHQRSRARRLGIGLAVFMRLALLGTVAFIVQLTQPLFSLFGHGFSWRDLILIAGGLFLIWKATTEIHDNVAGDGGHGSETSNVGAGSLSIASAIGQILVLDLKEHSFEQAHELYGDQWLGFKESTLHGFLKKSGFLQVEVMVASREEHEPHFETLLASGVKAGQ